MNNPEWRATQRPPGVNVAKGTDPERVEQEWYR